MSFMLKALVDRLDRRNGQRTVDEELGALERERLSRRPISFDELDAGAIGRAMPGFEVARPRASKHRRRERRDVDAAAGVARRSIAEQLDASLAHRRAERL